MANNERNRLNLENTVAYFVGIGGMFLFCGDWHIPIATWVSMTFLLRFVRNSKMGLNFGLVFLGAIIVSNISQHGMMPIENRSYYFIMNISYAVGFGLPVLLDRILYRPSKEIWTTLVFPSIVVSLEFIYSYNKYGSWGSLSHTQYGILPLLQISSLFGQFAVSFMICWLASIFNWLWENKFELAFLKKAGHLYVTIMVGLLIYGGFQLTPDRNETVRAAAIVSDTDFPIYFIDSTEVGPFTTDSIIANFLDQTDKAASNGAKIILWSEGALLMHSHQIPILLDSLSSIARSHNVYIVSAYLEYLGFKGANSVEDKNVLIGPDGKILWEYMKAIPFEGYEVPYVKPGTMDVPTVDTEYGRLGTLIGSEMNYPGYTKQIGEKNIDILLIPAIAWEGIASFYTQMSSMSSIRNGHAQLRACSYGVSAAYDSKGRTLAWYNYYNSGFGIMYADLPIKSSKSIVSYMGYAFEIINMLFLIAYIVWRLIELVTRRRS